MLTKTTLNVPHKTKLERSLMFDFDSTLSMFSFGAHMPHTNVQAHSYQSHKIHCQLIGRKTQQNLRKVHMVQ